MDDYGEPICAHYAPDFLKDPDAITDFAIDWSGDLGEGETLVTSVWTFPDGGLTQDSTLLEDAKTAIFVSGGTCGASYRLHNRVTTSGGRTWDKTLRIQIREA